MSEINSGQDSRKQGTIVLGWGKLGAIALAIAAPVFYLNGKAYHEGYLSYLNLEPSMFPLQASDFIEASAVAWFRVIIGWFTNGFDSLGKNWLWAVTGLVVLSLVLSLVDLMTDRPASGEQTQQKPLQTKQRSFLRSWRRVGMFLFVACYGVFSILCLISMSLAMVILPFSDAGREVARFDVARGFGDSPTVTLKMPGSEETTQFRIIQCANQFCGLFANGRAYTVPVSVVTWAVSGLPDVKAAKNGLPKGD